MPPAEVAAARPHALDRTTFLRAALPFAAALAAGVAATALVASAVRALGAAGTRGWLLSVGCSVAMRWALSAPSRGG